MRNIRRHAIGRLAAIATLGCLAVTACGTEQPETAGDGIASLDETTDEAPDGSSNGPSDGPSDGDVENTGDPNTEAGDAELEAPEDIEEAMTLFQNCMTEHGVEGGSIMVAASSAEGESIEVGRDFAEDEQTTDIPIEQIDPEVFEAANEACDGHLANAMPSFDLTPEQEAAMEDARLEFEKCMEDAGIDMPDMVTAGGGATLSVTIGESGELDDDSDGGQPVFNLDELDMEEFQAAADECNKIYDDYPELDDVMGGQGGAVMTATVGGAVGESVSAP